MFNKMKRLFAFVMAFGLVCCIAACGDSDSQNNVDSESGKEEDSHFESYPFFVEEDKVYDETEHDWIHPTKKL